WGEETELSTIFRSKVWAGVRAWGSPSLLSGAEAAKTSSVVLLIIWHTFSNYLALIRGGPFGHPAGVS
ncbi:MAG TPA: hypothetical protein VK638_26195, partial [Edaphobacter sp.]|nr:hypothetical protein [Edaphobacter sp.]